MSYANFHMHTAFSDGAIIPDKLVHKIFQEPGLDYFALTDHDSMSGIEPFFRSLKRHGYLDQAKGKRFVPGIEISLREENSGTIVHLVGLFPEMTHSNYRESLKKIDAHLGEFCRERCINRGLRDLDGRIKRAYELNLDGLAERFQSAEEIIGILRQKAEAQNRALFEQSEKEQDVIQHPIPFTYQTIVDQWEELFPNSNREIVSLYLLRPDQKKVERLAQLYQSQGKGEARAKALAETNQAILCSIQNPPPSDKGISEGLHLLQKAQAVTLLGHPAVYHRKGQSFEDYDNNVLYPLVDQGLDGIEVFYPYNRSYREEAIDHYAKIARDHGLLISGGTDYHGDRRIGLSDVKLDREEALRIIHHNGRPGENIEKEF